MSLPLCLRCAAPYAAPGRLSEISRQAHRASGSGARSRSWSRSSQRPTLQPPDHVPMAIARLDRLKCFATLRAGQRIRLLLRITEQPRQVVCGHVWPTTEEGGLGSVGRDERALGTPDRDSTARQSLRQRRRSRDERGIFWVHRVSERGALAGDIGLGSGVVARASARPSSVWPTSSPRGALRARRPFRCGGAMPSTRRRRRRLR
jgi:hypothetical protein